MQRIATTCCDAAMAPHSIGCCQHMIDVSKLLRDVGACVCCVQACPDGLELASSATFLLLSDAAQHDTYQRPDIQLIQLFGASHIDSATLRVSLSA